MGKGGRGKGYRGNDDRKQPVRITCDSLEAGQVVDVFHRYCQDPNGYFMVDYASSGTMHPSIGKTDGWTDAVVNQNWDSRGYNAQNRSTWPEIRWSHPLWYNRRGHRLDVSRPNMITQRVPPEQIRLPSENSEAKDQPCLTLIHIRWGGERRVDPVTEGAGGWGQIGATPSDNYINGLEDLVFRTMGPTYEIISCFYQNSAEFAMINPQLLRYQVSGQHVGALYFAWPIGFQDGHDYPAYVQREKLFDLMVRTEAVGIPTRFPHASHLYRIFASKEWTAQMCLHPLLKVPLTTRVARQEVACSSSRAAERAHKALANLAKARRSWAGPLGQEPGPSSGKGGQVVSKGVAKLGWSWEAMDVRVWHDKQELQGVLEELTNQPGSLMDLVFVQEWVDFDVEVRHFIVEPDINDPRTWRPKKIIYTVMQSIEDGAFRNFDRYDRATALANNFGNDEAAMQDAEAQAQELIGRWLQWLQAQAHELPVVVRFDLLIKRIGPGKAAVKTGELTELGGCFLGWPEGPEVVFSAMLRSCFRDPL